MIKFNQVTKTFPSGVTAIKNLTFEINNGEMVMITGPSGSGKTTILRLILKDIEPTSGNILINEFDLAKIKSKDFPALRRTIGAVFQDYKILEDQTAWENIGLIFDILNEKEKTARKKSLELLKMVGLEGKENLFPRQLSGGEIQRVAIARALALEPKILFADEPTANLDNESANSIISLLTDINRRGTMVLIATHNEDLLKNKKETKRIKITKNE